MKTVFGLILIAFIATTAQGADKNGNYKIGGGVGVMKCPEFLDVMATHRQLGGMNTESGAVAVNPEIEYVLGFQTGFNLVSTSGLDIFQKISPSEGVNALYAIEPYCQQHPDKNFGQALIWLATYLRDSK